MHAEHWGNVKIDASASGDNVVVAGVSGKQIFVYSISLVCSAAVIAQWKSGASAELSGPMSFAANGGYTITMSYTLPSRPDGLLVTEPGEDLVLNLSSAIAVGGHLSYRQS